MLGEQELGRSQDGCRGRDIEGRMVVPSSANNIALPMPSVVQYDSIVAILNAITDQSASIIASCQSPPLDHILDSINVNRRCSLSHHGCAFGDDIGALVPAREMQRRQQGPDLHGRYLIAVNVRDGQGDLVGRHLGRGW